MQSLIKKGVFIMWECKKTVREKSHDYDRFKGAYFRINAVEKHNWDTFHFQNTKREIFKNDDYVKERP